MRPDAGGRVAPADDAFRIGRVITLSAHVLGRAFLPICTIALLVAATQFVPALVQEAVGGAWITSAGGNWTLRFAADVVADSLGFAAVAYGAARVARGRDMFFRTSVSRAVGVAAPVFAIVLLLASPEVPAFFIRQAAISYFASAGNFPPGAYMFLGILPGLAYLAQLIGWSFLWVAIPAIVVERRTIAGAARRSLELTRGCRFRIFALLVAVSVAFGIGFGAVSALPLWWAVWPELPLWAGYGLNASFVAVWSVACGVTYVMLRTAKEGWSPDEVAKVFD